MTSEADDSSITLQKAALRPEMRARRKALGLVKRVLGSRVIEAALNALVPHVPTCAIYLATPQEVDIQDFAQARLDQGLQIVAPRGQGFAWLSDFERIQRRAFGLREPGESNPECSLQSIDCVLLPGLAFDVEGGRLGHGGGWYDRALAQLRPDALRIGVCFECQVVEKVPREEHDQGVHFLVTETQTRLVSNP